MDTSGSETPPAKRHRANFDSAELVSCIATVLHSLPSKNSSLWDRHHWTKLAAQLLVQTPELAHRYTHQQLLDFLKQHHQHIQHDVARALARLQRSSANSNSSDDDDEQLPRGEQQQRHADIFPRTIHLQALDTPEGGYRDAVMRLLRSR